MSKITKDIAEAVLEKPSFVKTVKVEKKPSLNWFSKLLIFLHFKSIPSPEMEHKDLYIYPSRVDTVYALSGLLHEVSDLAKEQNSEHKLAHDVEPLISRIIAVAITNKGDKAPDWLINIIRTQFTPAELNVTAKEVYRRLDYENFFDIIISLKAVNMIDIQETGAPGQ